MVSLKASSTATRATAGFSFQQSLNPIPRNSAFFRLTPQAHIRSQSFFRQISVPAIKSQQVCLTVCVECAVIWWVSMFLGFNLFKAAILLMGFGLIWIWYGLCCLHVEELISFFLVLWDFQGFEFKVYEFDMYSCLWTVMRWFDKNNVEWRWWTWSVLEKASLNWFMFSFARSSHQEMS